MPLRLPRLTLYTGSNCSLCETAKAELAKVRQARPFTLDIVNIHDAGQESWKRKYVYWIPALHLEGKEVAKGRWDGDVVSKALEQWNAEREFKARSLFFLDATGRDAKETSAKEHKYDRGSNTILGMEVVEAEGRGPQLRCFNCGNEGHHVRDCLEPRNRRLIALSRATYEYHREQEGGGQGTSGPERLHEVEEWKARRLRWVDRFSPGEIKGKLLREALGLRGRDKGESVEWLSRMLVWGYPRGWTGTSHPNHAVRRRISGGRDENHLQRDAFDFTIFGEDGSDETLHIRMVQSLGKDLGGMDDSDYATESESSSKSLQSRSSSPESQTENGVVPPRRWAHYQTSLFSSKLLPVYNGDRLPPMQSEATSQLAGDKTFTGDRASLWLRVLESRNQRDDGPRPPSSTPPPLPPPPLCPSTLPPLPPSGPPPSLPPLPLSDYILYDSAAAGWSSFEAHSVFRPSGPLDMSFSNGIADPLTVVDETADTEEDMDLSD